MKIKCLVLSMIILVLFCSCSSASSNSQAIEKTPVPTSTIKPTPTPSPTPVITKSKSEILLENMTLEQKVAQLFIVRPQAFTSGNYYGTDEIYVGNIKNYPVAGFTLFGNNIDNPKQLTEFTSSLQESSEIPLFMTIDEEGGLVSRIANNSNFDVTKFPNMQEIGKTNSTENATNVGEELAKYLKEYGFNWDFAPVCDVNTNSKNIVIGSRAFGSDPELVSGMISAEIKALQSNGVIASAKHFPGHGDTSADTHDGFVTIGKSLEDLENCELIPFKSAIEAGVDSIMVSHISCPNIDDSKLPSSLSYDICTEILRNSMGYDGIIITDGMEMGAVVNNYSSSEASALAIQAGVDIILLPHNFFQAYEGVLEAVKNGDITEERIDESVLHVLSLKEKYGLLN